MASERQPVRRARGEPTRDMHAACNEIEAALRQERDEARAECERLRERLVEAERALKRVAYITEERIESPLLPGERQLWQSVANVCNWALAL